MDRIRRFTARPVTERSTDPKVMDLLVALDSFRRISYRMYSYFVYRFLFNVKTIFNVKRSSCRNEENDTQRPAYSQDCSKIKAAPGEGCPRCGGAVYAAEQMLAKGSVKDHLGKAIKSSFSISFRQRLKAMGVLYYVGVAQRVLLVCRMPKTSRLHPFL
jgi:hypothetical protein